MSMIQGRTALQGLTFFCLIGTIGLLVSCKSSGGGGEGCAGFESQVSCLQIVSITPQNGAGDDTADVDAFVDDCDPDPDVYDPEPFTAHNALVKFSNGSLPTSDGGFDIRLNQVSVTYSLADCPASGGCPDLRGFSESETILIPTESEVEVSVPLVPLRVKQDYALGVLGKGNLALAVSSYVAHYVFTGETVPFSAAVTVEGDVAFHIGNFNLCSN